MNREENNKNEKDLEQELYSSLNIGSFLELKRKERREARKIVTEEMFPEMEEKPILKEEVSSMPQKVEPEKQVEDSKIKEALQKAKEAKPKKQEKKVEQKQEEKRGEVKPTENDTKLLEVKEETKPSLPKENIKEKVIEERQEKETSSVTENDLEKLVEEFEDPKEETEEKEEKPKKRKKEKKVKGGKQKKSKKLFIGVIICVLLDLFALTGLFLTYGPISYFRNLLVTSAMTTMNHQYLARIFYDEKTIQKVLASNVVKETEENTNVSDIDFSNAEDTGQYESAYEEQILKREKGQLYKKIDIKGNGYVGYLVAIYDPSRVHLVSATSYGYGGAFLTEIAKKNDAKVAINASGFADGSAVGKGSIPVGTVIQDGKIIARGGGNSFGGGIAGFNKDHVLVLTKESPDVALQNGIVDAVEFGPFLIVNGKAAEIRGNGGWGIAPRTVLAQRKDGIVLFLVIDGRNAKHSLGVDMNELINILKRYKAHNAVNLDGGGSSTLVVDGKLANIPCGSTCGERYVPNAWIVK